MVAREAYQSARGVRVLALRVLAYAGLPFDARVNVTWSADGELERALEEHGAHRLLARIVCGL